MGAGIELLINENVHKTEISFCDGENNSLLFILLPSPPPKKKVLNEIS